MGFLLNSTVEKAVVDGAQNHLLVPGRRPEPLDLHSTAYTYHLLEFKCVDIIYCPLSAPPSVSYFLYNCGNRNTLECKVWFFIDILSIKSTKSILQNTRSTILHSRETTCPSQTDISPCLMKRKIEAKQPTDVLFCNLF